MADEMPLALRRPRRDPTPAPVSMHCLYRPVRKEWGRTEWADYVKGDREHWRAGFRKWTEHQTDDYFDQKHAAAIWAAPASISLRVITPGHNAVVFEVAKLQRESLTLHHVINEVCAAQGLDRLAYFWNLQRPPVPLQHEAQAPDSANLAPPSHEQLRIAEEIEMRRDDEGADGRNQKRAFASLWEPGETACWTDESTFGPRVLKATAKPVPVRPTAAPDFSQLKSPPPASSASPEEWEAWLRANSGGSFTFWRTRAAAIEWRCPETVTLCLQGIWHSLVVQVAADAPLQLALDAFCAAAPRGAGVAHPHELKLTRGGTDDPNDREIDPRSTSARQLYAGSRHDPQVLRVLFRDEGRRAAARLARHGSTPEGHLAFRGSGYLLDEMECAWYVSRGAGCGTYDAVLEATALHDRHSGHGWQPMLGLLERLLLALKPTTPKRAARVETALHALDRLTAYLLATLVEDGWRHDARGKIIFWDMDCRRRSVHLMRTMDDVASEIVSHLQAATAAKEADATPLAPPGELFMMAARALPKRQLSSVPESLQRTVKRARTLGFGPEAALAQAKRLFGKLAQEYKGWAEPASGHHEGYHAFEKVRAIM